MRLNPTAALTKSADELRQAADWVRACYRGKRVYATRIGQETFPNRGGFPCIIKASSAEENKNALAENLLPPMSDTESASLRQRGKAIYENKFRSQLDTPDNRNTSLVIEPDSEDYEVHANLLHAMNLLRARHPRKHFYSQRIGEGCGARLSGFSGHKLSAMMANTKHIESA